MDRTVVENAEGFQAGQPAVLATTPWEFWFAFFWPKDYVTVEDMTLAISGPNPCEEYSSIFLASFRAG